MTKWKVKRDEEPTFVPKKNKDKDKNKNKSKEKALEEKERELKEREAKVKKREKELNNNSELICNDGAETKQTTLDKYLKEAGVFKRKSKEEKAITKEKRKSVIRNFASALISPRKGELTRLEFGIYLAVLLVIGLLAAFFATGSIFQVFISIATIIFSINLICQRFKKIGLKWYLPIIAGLLFIISGFVGAWFLYLALSFGGADSETYNAIINLASTLDNSLGNEIIIAVVLLFCASILYVLFLLFTIILCFLKDNKCKSGKVMNIIYISVVLITAILLPLSSYLIMNATSNTVNLAAKIVHKSIFTQQDDGTYLVNGTFMSGTDASDFNEVVNYYNEEQTNPDIIKNYNDSLSYMTEYTNNLCISSLMGQNATKGNKVVGILELGVVKINENEDNNKFIIENIVVGGTTIIVKQEYQLNNKVNFLMIETPPLADTEEITITTIYNGETRVINSILIDLQQELNNAAAQQNSTDATDNNW